MASRTSAIVLQSSYLFTTEMYRMTTFFSYFGQDSAAEECFHSLVRLTMLEIVFSQAIAFYNSPIYSRNWHPLMCVTLGSHFLEWIAEYSYNHTVQSRYPCLLAWQYSVTRFKAHYYACQAFFVGKKCKRAIMWGSSFGQKEGGSCFSCKLEGAHAHVH